MFCTFTLTATAFAQAPGKVAAEESGWLVWVVLGGAGLIILITGFMNPKRSHLS
jgi:hypothetical protein